MGFQMCLVLTATLDGRELISLRFGHITLTLCLLEWLVETTAHLTRWQRDDSLPFLIPSVERLSCSLYKIAIPLYQLQWWFSNLPKFCWYSLSPKLAPAHRLCVVMRMVRFQMSIRRPDILNVARLSSGIPRNVEKHSTLRHECFLRFPLQFSFNVLLINVWDFLIANCSQLRLSDARVITNDCLQKTRGEAVITSFVWRKLRKSKNPDWL